MCYCIPLPTRLFDTSGRRMSEQLRTSLWLRLLHVTAFVLK